MSAIVGLVNFKHHTIPTEYGQRMMQALHHFPSDARNVYYSDHLFFGHHGQWITPESVGEVQPYRCRESGYVVTADAILDNRPELFDQLDIPTHQRKNMTDAQLILKAYLKWNSSMPEKLIGDFAFMIWDESEKQLFGARDFSGLRPLYYAQTNDRFQFASTIASLHALPDIHKNLNEQWIAEFLAIPEFVPAVSIEQTPYQHIHQVPPAHSITVKNNKINLQRYVKMIPAEQIRFKRDEEYEEAFLEIYERAVRDRTRTFKKVGAFLSGGLDSGSVASVAARQLADQNKRLTTFSSVPATGYTDWLKGSRIADEREYIMSMVNHSGNMDPHFESFDERNSYTEIDQWLSLIESPYKFFENSHWLRGINEKASEMGAGILLSGSRGNHTVSWGHAFSHYGSLLRKGHAFRLMNEIQQHHLKTGTGRAKIIKNVFKSAFPDESDAPEMSVLISPHLANKTNIEEKLNEYPIMRKDIKAANNSDKRNKYFTHLYYLGNLSSAAKLSLKYNVWTRDATSDLRVVKFCLSIPEEQFVQSGMDRALIRRSMKDIMPDKVRFNYHIRGLQSADTAHRLQQSWGTLKEELLAITTDHLMGEYLNTEKLYRLTSSLPETPEPNLVLNYDFKLLMRGLILSRFISNSLKGGEIDEKELVNALASRT